MLNYARVKGRFTFILMALVLGLSPSLSVRAEDPFQGLDEAIDESKLDADSSKDSIDFSELEEAQPSGSPTQTASNPVPSTPALSAAPTQSPTAALPANASQEDMIRAEFEAYAQRRQEEDEERRLRQAIFHEGAKNIINFDATYGDLAKFKRPSYTTTAGTFRSDRGGDTTGFAIGYNRVLMKARRVGRLSLGLNAGGIVTMGSSSRSRMAFYNVGPRAQFEFQFSVGQMLIPVAYVGYDKVFNLENSTDPTMTAALNKQYTDDFNTFVYGAGLLVNLNTLDTRTATQSLVSTGIRRFSLALLYHKRQGDTASRSSDGAMLGLRFDY